MRVIVIGCLEETLDTLSCLYYLGGKVNALVSLPQPLAEKANASNWVDLQSFAKQHNLPLYYVNKYSMKDMKDCELIRKLESDIIIVLGWQRLIPEKIINEPLQGCIGFHGSSNFLPWGRGHSPINWSIIEGRNRFVLHMFFITPGIDDGNIIGFEIYDIQPEDNCRSVYYKTSMAQAKLLHRFLPLIQNGECPSYPQIGDTFHYPKRTPDDGKINWLDSAEQVCRLIRATTLPYPGAFSFLGNKKILIWEAQPFGNSLLTAKAKPGEVIFISSNNLKEFVVMAAHGAILVTKYDSSLPIRAGDVFND